MMNRPLYLFRAGWRVFFWAAGLWAVLSMAVWVGWLWISETGGDAGQLGLNIAPQFWHAHEILFGYGTAALGGFFLTAVPNWTGAKAAPERFIAIVFLIWLAGRIAVAFSGMLLPLIVAMVDLAFLPVLAAKLLSQLLIRPKPQNMVLLLMLSMIWISNLMVHLQWMGLTGTEWQGLRGGLLLICVMIAIIGGRIVPSFTRNVLVREGREDALPVSRKPFDVTGIILPVLTALSVVAGLPDGVSGVLALMAGPAVMLRLSGWRGWLMRHQPIVWVLHVSYAFLSVGLFVWGLAQIGFGSEIGALHILGIGAVGGMTLAVMSRASLGHSGRPLIAPGPVATAYALIPPVVLLRWAGSAWDGFYTIGVIGSGLIWIVAFMLYLWSLWPVFFALRPDGKSG
ncbi:MAG: NnrS family protein [Paracoccus sp. (in: a-proteobacteria)]